MADRVTQQSDALRKCTTVDASGLDRVCNLPYLHKESHVWEPLPLRKLQEALAHIEQIVKPFDISMSGESHFQRLEAPRVKQIWNIAREALDGSVDKEGLDPGDNEPMTYDNTPS